MRNKAARPVCLTEQAPFGDKIKLGSWRSLFSAHWCRETMLTFQCSLEDALSTISGGRSLSADEGANEASSSVWASAVCKASEMRFFRLSCFALAACCRRMVAGISAALTPTFSKSPMANRLEACLGSNTN